MATGGVQTRRQAAALADSHIAGNDSTLAAPTTGVGRGSGLPVSSTIVSSLATPLAAIGRGLRTSLATPLAAIERGLNRLTPGQVKIVEFRQAGTPPGSPRTPASTRVVPTLAGSATVVPLAAQVAPAVVTVLDATAAPFAPATVMTPVVTAGASVSVATTLTTSVGKGASRASRSRASSVHSVTNTTVVNMLATLQAQVAALRQSTVSLVTAPTEDVLSQLDDGDISSVSEHRTRHWVADSTSQNYAYDMAGTTTAVDAGSVLTSLPEVLVQSQVATSSIAGGKPSVAGTKSVSVARGKKSGVSGVSCPVQAPTFPVVLDSRPLVYNGESAVGPFLSQFQYTAELRGWPRET
jgi:hypothetical protein